MPEFCEKTKNAAMRTARSKKIRVINGTETEMMAWYHSRLVGILHTVNAHVEGGDQGDEWSDERHEAAQDV